MTLYKFWDTILDNQGRPVPGATITVSLYPSGTATIYADADGNTEITGCITDTTGYYEFYCASGNYTLTIDGAGIGTRQITDVTIGQASIWGSEAANRVFASPNGSTGEPNFRALVADDLPSEASAWTALTDIDAAWNGVSDASSYGAPKYCIRNNIVYFRGELQRGTGVSVDGESLLTLPSEARPGKYMEILLYADSGALRASVGTTGLITVGAGAAMVWLSGSYPQASIG